jgi:hypothetical protein
MQRFLLLYLFLSIVGFSSAQSCLPNGITFGRQAQVDSFPINYPGCTEIEGLVVILTDSIYSLDSLYRLEKIAYGLSIDAWFPGMSLLKSLSGLDNLEEVGGFVSLNSLWQLADLNGLNGLRSMGGSLGITYCDSLYDLSGLDSLKRTGGLSIGSNSRLSDLTALSSLESVVGTVKFYHNQMLEDLTGIDQINPDSIWNLLIVENPALEYCHVTSICNYLQSPKGVVDIYRNAPGCSHPPDIAAQCGFTMSCLPYGNYYLTSQEEIDSFAIHYPGCTELYGNLYLESYDINDLSGLSHIKKVDSNFMIRGNTYLTDLSGLESLRYVNVFNMRYTNLQSLSGVDSLEIVNYTILLFENDLLTDITALSGISPDSLGRFNITNNDLLSECDIQPICDWIQMNPSVVVYVDNNAVGCASVEEIEDACDLKVNEDFTTQIRIYPNPCNQIAYVSGIRTNINGTIKVINQLGQPMIHKKLLSNSLDISDLPKGLYLVAIITANNCYKQQLIIN